MGFRTTDGDAPTTVLGRFLQLNEQLLKIRLAGIGLERALIGFSGLVGITELHLYEADANRQQVFFILALALPRIPPTRSRASQGPVISKKARRRAIVHTS